MASPEAPPLAPLGVLRGGIVDSSHPGVPRSSLHAILAGGMGDSTVFQFLFRLSADARVVDGMRFRKRLVTGIANHYGASACNVHQDLSGRPVASADVGLDLAALPAEDRERLFALEQDLVRRAVGEGAVTSALDLDRDGEVHDFLGRALGVMDIFAFPQTHDGRSAGALVLYLPTGSKPLREADIQAMGAVGDVLAISDEKRRS